MPILSPGIERPTQFSQVADVNMHHQSGRAWRLDPIGRNSHRLCSNQTDIFMMGGYTYRPEFYCCDLWRFDKRRIQWFRVAKDVFPSCSLHPSFCTWGDWLVLFGGADDTNGSIPVASNAVWLLQPYHEPWALVRRLRTDGEPPPMQTGESIAVHRGQLYVVGKSVEPLDDSCDVHRLDLRTRRWTWLQRRSAVKPDSRSRHDIVLQPDGRIWLLGSAMSLRVVWEFDLTECRWRRHRTLPDESLVPERQPVMRTLHSFAHETNGEGNIEVIIAGGTKEESNTYYDDIWRLNLGTMRWRLMVHAIFEHPLYQHAAAADGDGPMYIFGGKLVLDFDAVQSNNMIRVWTKVPALARLSWRVMCHNNPRLLKSSAERLLELGVPQRFVSMR